jgi:hypothetical protein
LKNYRGINSSYGPDRTLVIKEGRCGKFLPPTSSLPEWFHPNYYDTADKVYLQLRRPPSATASVPFKSTGRYPSEADDMGKTRKRILKTKLNFLQTASYAASQAPTDQQLSMTSESQDHLPPLEQHHHHQEQYPPTDYYYYSIYSKSPRATSSPRYSSPRRCDRPHSQLPETGSFNPSNPWTATSSGSTMNSTVYHGSSTSPRSIHLSSSSCSSGSHPNGYISVNELSSQYFDQEPKTYRSTTSSIHSNTNPTTMYSARGDHDVSLSTVDSLLVKAATRQRNLYKVPDYTLGALDQQSTSRLIIPPMEFPELDEEINLLSRLPTTPLRPPSSSPLASSLPTLTSPSPATMSHAHTTTITPSPSSTPLQRPISVLNNLSKTIKEKEKEKQALETLYAVTTATTAVENEDHHHHLHHNHHHPHPTPTSPGELINHKEKKIVQNKANQTLSSIHSSRGVTKSSLVMDEMIPFDINLTGSINRWTRERNYVESDIMRPRQCICRGSRINEKKKKKKSSILSSPSEEEEGGSSKNSSSLDYHDDDQSLQNEGDFSPREFDSDSNEFLEESSTFSA